MKDLFIQEAVRRKYAKDYHQAQQLRDRLRTMFPSVQSNETLLSLIEQLRGCKE